MDDIVDAWVQTRVSWTTSWEHVVGGGHGKHRGHMGTNHGVVDTIVGAWVQTRVSWTTSWEHGYKPGCRGRHRGLQVNYCDSNLSWVGVVDYIVDSIVRIIDVNVSWVHVVEYIVGTRVRM